MLAPGATVRHTEHWTLHRNVRIELWNDDGIDRTILPLVG
jgi:hypothetical protein